MTISLVMTGNRAEVQDTDAGVLAAIALAKSVGVTEWTHYKISVATGTTDQAVAFAGVSAAKALILLTDEAGAITYKLNGGTTAIPLKPLAVHLDSAGGITSATYTNASGSTVVIDILIGG